MKKPPVNDGEHGRDRSFNIHMEMTVAEDIKAMSTSMLVELFFDAERDTESFGMNALKTAIIAGRELRRRDYNDEIFISHFTRMESAVATAERKTGFKLFSSGDAQ